MNSEETKNKFKIVIAILAVLLLVLGIYTASLYSDQQEVIEVLELQKGDIEDELESLIANYDQVIQDNETKDQELMAAKERIEVLLDSVKDADANKDLIVRYRAEIKRLKEERTMLFRKADSLMLVNNQLVIERDSTSSVLGETRREFDSVNAQNAELAALIKRGAVVSATDLRGQGVIIRKSGKIVDTRRSKRADKIRACFTLAPNPLTKKGDRKLYIQVINPKNNLLGERKKLRADDGKLNYSAVTTVYYENEELDVCALVDAEESELVSGRYIINVFDGLTQVASSSMTLK